MESAVESLAFLLEAIKQEVADINLLGRDLTSAEKAKVSRHSAFMMTGFSKTD